ncbi:MAG TPA: hypothetical protein VH561_16865 [Micromonosporaceae bacterium]
MTSERPAGYRDSYHERRMASASKGGYFTRPGQRLNGEPWSEWTHDVVEGAPRTDRSYGPDFKADPGRGSGRA